MVRSKSPVTLRDLAKSLKIDVSTVSRVLNGDPVKAREAASEETAQRIKRLADRLGYRANIHAANLKMRQSQQIGVLMPRLSDIVMATVYDGIDEAAQEAGYTAFVLNTLDDPERQLSRAKQALQMRVAGLIISDTHVGAKQPLLDLLTKEAVPYVLVYRRHAKHPAVAGDDLMGGKLAAEHLYSRGHRRVGILAGYSFARSSIDRYQGFLKYFRECGVEVPETAVISGDVDAATGREQGHALMQRYPDVSAIFAINDFLAIGCMGVLRDRGRVVGKDVAVVGYNDTPIAAELPVALTSVHVPMKQVGRKAIELLLARVNDQSVKSVNLMPELRIRSSSDFDVPL
jgi:LacI family transcriptional regulator